MLSRLVIPLALASALVAALPTGAVGEDAAAPAALPASVRLVDCSREAHSATFLGRMRGVEGSDRMRMRFTLLEKRAGVFEAVEAPGLDRWRRSKPGVGTFRYRQIVRGLKQGSAYRMQVAYRWYDADGALIERTRRRSPVCRQFLRLPNLRASIVGAARTKVDGVLRYGVRVANLGAAAADDAAVRMTVDGGVVDTVTLARLDIGESRLLSFRGPACESSVTAAADPDGVMVESSEADNAQTLACAEIPRR